MPDPAHAHPVRRLLQTLAARHLRHLAVSALALWLGACTMLGPDFVPPQTTLPTAWEEQSTASSRARAAYWWRLFNDPLLDLLVARAYQQNLTLEAAGLRILQAGPRWVSPMPWFSRSNKRYPDRRRVPSLVTRP